MVNTLRRNSDDANGNRRVDCDLMNFAPNAECGAFVAGTGPGSPFNDTVRPATPATENVAPAGGLVSPRFVRLHVQLNF